MSTITAGAVDSDRVLAAASLGRAIESDLAALVAVRRVGRPSDLVPSALKALADLREGGSRNRQCEKGGLEKHLCCGVMRWISSQEKQAQRRGLGPVFMRNPTPTELILPF